MLLSYPQQPVKSEFGFTTPHDDFIDNSPAKPRKVLRSFQQHRRTSPVQGGRLVMTSNSAHIRNLPPPPPPPPPPPQLPLTLPDPRALPQPGPHPVSHSTSHSVAQPVQLPLASLPPPPSQWQGHEEYMRSWLQTKSEEERRRQEEERSRQEEERSRQEQYRLEQRRVEHNMLQDGIRAGVPPVFLPMLCLSITAGANLANVSGAAEALQQYAVQLSNQWAPRPLSSESIRPVAQSSQQSSQQPGPSTGYSSSQPRSNFAGSPQATRQQFDLLPRLATATANTSSQNQAVESPIYFHHWTPPTSQSANANSNSNNNNNNSNSNSGGGNNNSVVNSGPSVLSETQTSPKKRKNTTSHSTVPSPFSRLSTTSDTGGRRIGHTRHRSDASIRGHSPHDSHQSKLEPNSSHTGENPSKSNWRVSSPVAQHSKQQDDNQSMSEGYDSRRHSHQYHSNYHPDDDVDVV